VVPSGVHRTPAVTLVFFRIVLLVAGASLLLLAVARCVVLPDCRNTKISWQKFNICQLGEPPISYPWLNILSHIVNFTFVNSMIIIPATAIIPNNAVALAVRLALILTLPMADPIISHCDLLG